MIKYNESYSLGLWQAQGGKIKVVIHSNYIGGHSKLNGNAYSTIKGAIAAIEREAA